MQMCDCITADYRTVLGRLQSRCPYGQCSQLVTHVFIVTVIVSQCACDLTAGGQASDHSYSDAGVYGEEPPTNQGRGY